MPDNPQRRVHGLRRLPDYDYTQPGAYFVTIVVQDRFPLFGEIVDDVMIPSAYGHIVQQVWNDLPNHYPHVELDTFIVMPNHVHGTIILKPDPAVGAGLKPAPTAPAETPAPSALPSTGPISPRRHGLPEIVRAFKTFSARRINEQRN